MRNQIKYYTGVGSRETPDYILELMRKIAVTMNENGYVLRSGHADGADLAFEEESATSQIFLPWTGFNGSSAPNNHIVMPYSKRCEEIASLYHPAWHNCSDGAKKLHMRNVYQVLGPELNETGIAERKSRLVICWTKDGKGGGGTGQAIRIAAGYQIPVFDLGGSNGLQKLIDFGTQL